MSQDQSPGEFSPPFEGTWGRLSQVAVKGAEYDSPERQPHPKCLEGTRVTLLNYIHELLDDREKSRIIWLHGTAGVGKSAVAFTVAERMRGLKVTEQTNIEKRLAGTFFFSRKHTKRCTTGYFFATLVYQLASNFPSVREDVNRAIRENPALLDPDKSLRDQLEALFIRPLRKLRFRLRGCPPLAFVVDALDECRPETVADLISLLGQALRDPDLPVTHILLTSRSEEHIRKAIRKEEMRLLVCEIPVNTSGEGVAATISLDGADVDNDIYIFLQHSFRELESRHPDFPQPTADKLARLASRAGRRFIVASTIINFIDDRDYDPRDRLQLMLDLTSEMLPGTEVYKLYDCILSTCADPKRAYLHLSVVAALANPLPISEISKLLGPGQGSDVETALVQLRSVIDIPTDSSLPVNIYHSSVRDYVSNPSNCNVPQVQYIMSPHSLLARSSLRLMMQDIPESTALLDALLELKRQSQAMLPDNPQRLKDSLSFIVQPLEPLRVIICLLWLRGDSASDLQSWLETPDGRAYLQTHEGKDWLQNQGGKTWLPTLSGKIWLRTQEGEFWLQTQGGKDWLQTQSGRHWLQTQSGKDWLQTREGEDWLQTHGVKDWLWTQSGQDWLQTRSGQDWLWIKRCYRGLDNGLGWLQTVEGRHWLENEDGRDWLQTCSGRDWLQTEDRRYWSSECVRQWLKTLRLDWLDTYFRPDCAGQLDNTSCFLLMALIGITLRPMDVRSWWLQVVISHWVVIITMQPLILFGDPLYPLLTRSDLLLCMQSFVMIFLLQLSIYFRNPLAVSRLQPLQIMISLFMLLLLPLGLSQLLLAIWVHNLLRTVSGRERLQTRRKRDWLLTSGGRDLLKGREWLQTQSGRGMLQTQGGRDWLETRSGKDWLETKGGREWLQAQRGRDWLQTQGGREWLQTQIGGKWLQTQIGRDWLQTQSGQDWLQMPHGREWQSTLAASVWVTMEEFSSTLEAITEYPIIPELPSLPAFQVIMEFKSLPDFLMFPAFLALWHQDFSTSPLPRGHSPPDMEIIHAMKVFESFANETRERSRLTSDALKYACQNWAVHLSQAPTPWDDTLNHTFKSFWNRHLLSWLERQWCSKDLRSCLAILSKAEKLAKEHALQAPGSSQSRI